MRIQQAGAGSQQAAAARQADGRSAAVCTDRRTTWKMNDMLKLPKKKKLVNSRQI